MICDTFILKRNDIDRGKIFEDIGEYDLEIRANFKNIELLYILLNVDIFFVLQTHKMINVYIKPGILLEKFDFLA